MEILETSVSWSHTEQTDGDIKAHFTAICWWMFSSLSIPSLLHRFLQSLPVFLMVDEEQNVSLGEKMHELAEPLFNSVTLEGSD